MLVISSKDNRLAYGFLIFVLDTFFQKFAQNNSAGILVKYEPINFIRFILQGTDLVLIFFDFLPLFG